MSGGSEGAAPSDGEGFWRFSLAFYARPGTASALLALQDDAGCDVNRLLFAMWCGAARGHRLAPAELAAAEAAMAGASAASVAPLRQLRRRLRSDPAEDAQALGRRIGAVELAAERRVQYRLAAAVPPPDRPAPDRFDAATENLNLALGIAMASAPAATLRAAMAEFLQRS